MKDTYCKAIHSFLDNLACLGTGSKNPGDITIHIDLYGFEKVLAEMKNGLKYIQYRENQEHSDLCERRIVDRIEIDHVVGKVWIKWY